MATFERSRSEGRGALLCLLAMGLPLLGCGGDGGSGGLADAGSIPVSPVEGGEAGITSSGSGASTAGSGAGRSGTGGAGAAGAGSGSAGTTAAATDRFSFFVTSYAAMQRLSKSQSGFGGDLRYGEPDGLSGADKICTEIAESSMPGSGAKGWRAFLSVTKGPAGTPIHAIDRIGSGPWYDRRGRLLAMTRADLLSDRPMGGDPTIANDFPNEEGVPNHAPDGNEQVDNHDTLTGTNDQGQVYSMDWAATCHDWTSAVGSDGQPRVGHSWPRDFGMGFGGSGAFPTGGRGGFPTGGRSGFPTGGRSGFPTGGRGGGMNINGVNWMSSLDEAGCAPGASLIEMGPPNLDNPTVGSGGGYGGIYCFALMP